MSSVFGIIPGMPGGAELIIIAVIILLLFGNRVPSVMRSLGQGITEFKKGVQGVEEEEEEESADKPAVTNEKKDTAAAKTDDKD